MCFATSIVESHRKLSFLEADNYTKPAIEVKQKMSRTKSRLQYEICGDCGASDPTWASINRGILLCTDCCSVHRSLGRHISLVKSLRQGNWEPSILNFVNSLNSHGANSVWEHHLLDGSNIKGTGRIRKPTPKDPLHPVKSEFIKAKHVNLAFVLKPQLQDDEAFVNSNIEQELSKQLHASVRTSNLETSLRLLVQGADPNYFHEEKLSTPLHVAAKFGQALQIELLLIYGAHVNAIDGNGLTPLETAKLHNHNTITERLIDVLYEVTDRLIMFLGGKKPDHSVGRSFIIPEINNEEITEQLKIARGRLQLVPNRMFEELVMDLYDEVDRRENEAIWATTSINSENVAVPFLPPNPFLSATRNQGRQKLARFSHAEFSGLLTDVLIDARRRQNMANLHPLGSLINKQYNPGFNVKVEHDPNLSDDDDEPIYDPVASDEDYAPMPMEQQIKTFPDKHIEMETLRKQINEYVTEINQLKTVVQKLSSENSELKLKFSNSQVPNAYDETLRVDSNGLEAEKDLESPSEAIIVPGSNSSSASSSANNSNQSTIKRPSSMYERRLVPTLNKSNNESRTTTSMYHLTTDKILGEEVKHRTDVVTRRLKELILAMQDSNNKESLVSFAERIRLAVMELTAIFTSSSNYSEIIKDTLQQLTRYNNRIQHECQNLQKSYNSDDKAESDMYVKEVRDCAYYIASAVKTLVMHYE